MMGGGEELSRAIVHPTPLRLKGGLVPIRVGAALNRRHRIGLSKPCSHSGGGRPTVVSDILIGVALFPFGWGPPPSAGGRELTSDGICFHRILSGGFERGARPLRSKGGPAPFVRKGGTPLRSPPSGGVRPLRVVTTGEQVHTVVERCTANHSPDKYSHTRTKEVIRAPKVGRTCMLSHTLELNVNRARVRAIALVGLMVLSTSLAAMTATASNSKQYPVTRNPLDLATGDFDCDGDDDIVTASEMGNFMSILWNDAGTYQERSDIWVSNNNSRRAGFTDIADVGLVESGDIDNDGNDDIVFYQGNIQVYGSTEIIRGNITVLLNADCAGGFTEDAVYTMGDIVWEMQVGDVNGDGADDIVALELNDLASGTQQLRTFLGGANRNQQTSHKTTVLDNLANKVYADLRLGNLGEAVVGGPIGNDCDDLDAFMHFWPGFNAATGFSDGDWDNVSIVQFECTLDTFAAWNDPNKQTTIKLDSEYGVFDIADNDGDGKIDTMAITSVTDIVISECASAPCTSQATWPKKSVTPSIGSFIPASVELQDVNQDGVVDLVVPTTSTITNLQGASGNTVTSYSIDNLEELNTVQILLADGSGGYHQPQSMPVGRRPTMVLVGQFAGGPTSALDLAIGNRDYTFRYSNGALHIDSKGCAFDPLNPQLNGFGCGNLDAISVVQLDNEDVGISGMSVSPASFNPDTGRMTVGEGTREVNVTVQNTGLDSITGNVDVDVSVKEIVGGTDTIVYSNDYENPATVNCGTGCTWVANDYDGEAFYWHEEISSNHSAAPDGWEADVNPTDYMWAGTWYPNASAGNQLESGYLSNQDEALIMRNVDLTGADAAELELDLFCSAGYSVVHYVNSQGAISGMVIYDDSCNIDVYTDDDGWVPIVYRGGYDLVRINEYYRNGGSIEYTSSIYHFTGTNYSWLDMKGNNSLDLTPWAGETVDIRFRFRTGYDGSVGRDNTTRNTQWDGMAFDNLTIKKTVTQYGQVQPVSQTLSLNNFAPGDEQTITLNAYFTNDTEYMIEGALSNPTGFINEDAGNDDTRWKLNVLNLYDPAVKEITSFEPGQLYPSGDMPIDVIVENAGNTIMDFDVEATIYTAQPNPKFSNPCKNVEDFEPSACAYMFGDDSDGKGGIIDDSAATVQNAIVPGNRPMFGSNAYWFGGPDAGYEDGWNESMTLQTIDLRNMGGDFAYLTFDYFAESDYLTDQDGNIVGVNEYGVLEISWRKGSQTYEGVVYGSWNDYNENGILGGPNQTCEDIDEDNIYDEVEYMGDHTDEGNYFVWFDSEGIVKGVTLDLTHIVIQNRTGASTQWRTECTSMAGAEVDLTFRFLSNNDQINGSSGFAGFAMDNITVQEYTFTPVTGGVYTTTVNGIDAREERNVSVASHAFEQGIYRIDVMSVYDNVTAGNNWTDVKEVAVGNNLSRVIFEVASVDVTLYRPDVLDCVEDVDYDCVYPIDQALTHQFTVPLSNGVLAGDYNIYLDIVDSSGATVSSSTSTNSPITLGSHKKSNATFQPYTGWQDGETYDLRFYAKLTDGTSSGNQRNFTITFADRVDVAILSNPTDQNRLQSVKQDLLAMGMTYTQFRQTNWDEYLTSGWLAHYDKVLLPWQTNLNVISGNYYGRLGETATETTLQNYMMAGGTIEIHLGPYAQGLDDNLLYNMDILNRDTAGNRITHNDLNVADPYHPLLADISDTAWLTMNNGNYVANAALSTENAGSNKLPTPCSGLINSQQGTFHSLLNHESDSSMHLLATCGIGSGGLIVTTIDVENPSVSEAYGSTSVPIRSNLLGFMVTPYPSGFGIAGNGWDLTINNASPSEADPLGEYSTVRYLKSNAQVTLGFTSEVGGLDADWEIRGATDWNRNQFPPNVDYAHRSDDSHDVTFCLIDTNPQGTGCIQDATWDVTLYLHDAEGHTRITHITIQTNDILADEHDPVANVTVQEHALYPESLEDHGTKSSGGTDWPVYLVKLSASGDVKVKFDACGSYDPDAMDGDSGITNYIWKVYQDYPWNNPSNDFDGHTFERTAAMGCDWTYTFRNQTADPSGFAENPIRIELEVEDRAGRDSEKVKLYFVVVPEDWGDDAPVWEIQTPLDGSTQSGDHVWVNGTVISGSEDGDVAIEAALDSSVLNETIDEKVKQLRDGKFADVRNLGDGAGFSLKLKIEDLYDENGSTQTIYLKIVEGDGQTWTLYQQIDINLPPQESNVDPCEADPTADGCDGAAGTSGQGEGGMGALIYAGIGAIVLLVIVIATLLVLRMRGGAEDVTGFTGVEEMDPMEAYVQQLIAQGYPEDTARAYAQQYAGHFQQ